MRGARAGKIAATPARLQAGGSRQAITRCRQAPSEVWLGTFDAADEFSRRTQALPNVMFEVMLEGSHKLIAYVAGRMRRYRIRITPGDRIRVELSPYDLDRGGSSTGTGTNVSRNSKLDGRKAVGARAAEWS